MSLSRRSFLQASLSGLAAASSLVARAGLARPVGATLCVAPTLLRRALAALESHRDGIVHRDYMGVIDFSLPSSAPRFHVIALGDGIVNSYLVAHGRGSDPLHTGRLERFSNEPRSNATAAGAYRTGDIYSGEHGSSIRLEGLDSTNDNAYSRAIVIHSAWYVSQTAVERSGVLGRSQGCFAVSTDSLPEITRCLASGRLIYAGQV